MTQHYEITPSATHVHWGYFDGALAPVLTIEPDSVVTLHTLSCGPEDLPPPGSRFTVIKRLNF
jgi:hypothetical protein